VYEAEFKEPRFTPPCDGTISHGPCTNFQVHHFSCKIKQHISALVWCSLPRRLVDAAFGDIPRSEPQMPLQIAFILETSWANFRIDDRCLRPTTFLVSLRQSPVPVQSLEQSGRKTCSLLGQELFKGKRISPFLCIRRSRAFVHKLQIYCIKFDVVVLCLEAGVGTTLITHAEE
jgi:hypothetical protein